MSLIRSVLSMARKVTDSIKHVFEAEKTVKELHDIKYALDKSAIVTVTNPHGDIVYVNDKFCELSKYSRQEVIGKNHREFNSGFHGKLFYKKMWSTITKGQIWKGEIRNVAKDGSLYWVDTTIVPFLDKKGKPFQYISIRNDVTARKEAEERTYQLAYYDPLTGLGNQHFLNVALKTRLTTSNLGKLAVLFVGLNRFHDFHDRYGQTLGNELLLEVSKRLRETVGEHGMLFHYSKDEFIIILENENTLYTEEFAQHIVDTLEKPMEIKNNKLYVSVSIGIAFYKDEATNSEILMKNAHLAMASVQSMCKLKFHFFNEAMDQMIERKMLLENELHQAIENKELDIHYQPQIDLQSNRVVGVEALARWNHPRLGMIPPTEFIPIAEETGLILPLGEWVLQKACEQQREWKNKGFCDLRISVNASVYELGNKDYVPTIKRILEETACDPTCLEIEITESAMQNFAETELIIENLNQLGIRVSVDDFGTGYSSLSVLNKLRIDSIKIDRSFTHQLFWMSNTKMLIHTMIQMGKNLNFQIVTEGIETQEQAEFLKQTGCHIGQGYLYSKPIRATEFETLFLKEERLAQMYINQ